MDKIDWNTILMTGLVGAVSTLVMGRTLRRLLLLPFEWWARKTENKLDDQIVADAERDLGIEPTKFEEEKKPNDPNA